MVNGPVTIKKLDTNYRSEPCIINFNNAFFTEAARLEEVSAYDDVCQQWPKDKPMNGHVEVTLLPSEGYAEAMLTHVSDCIKRLIDAGAKPRDIAILVRNNAHIPLLANHLLETQNSQIVDGQIVNIDVVSDEAFRLDASPAVQLIVAALRYIAHPNDVIVRAFLAKATSGRIDGPLPPAFDDHIDELSRQPLYELTEQLYAIFSKGASPEEGRVEGAVPLSSHAAYLYAFYDKVAEYVGENSGGINEFLRYWDETLCSATIQSPEMNGLRIISIHKSKGLEFPHVIIPFCDWRLEHSDILWCHPKEEPFNQLPLAPIDYSAKGMKGTIYEDDYNEEHQQTIVDNLNLLYVAFTRASRNLFVFGRRGSKASRSALIEQVLQSSDFINALNGKPESVLADDILHFSYGTLTPLQKNSQIVNRGDREKRDNSKIENSQIVNNPNPFLQKSTPLTVQMAVYSHKTPLGQSNQSTRFAAGDDDNSQIVNGVGGQIANYIQLGNVLHNVFSTIHTQSDIDQALLMLEQEGIIYDQEITRQRLEQLIRKRLADPRVADWFSPHWKLYNECTIITPDGQSFRPDRVMTDGQETIVVDFKFGNERDSYHDQVRDYMSLLTQMGMPHVTGYLWFVYSNKIVPVK